MTVSEILVAISPYKQMTRDTLYKHFRALKINPLGEVRQSPQHYPDDSAERVLVRLGFKQPLRQANRRHRSRSRRQLQKEAA